MRKIYGLVVCGGESSRMGMDKSLLVYHNKPQRYYLYELLQKLCNKVFISCNKKQASAITEGYEKIVDLDKYANIGPMAALLSAFEVQPDADFLVIACDYPFLKTSDIQMLLDARDTFSLAVSYINPETNFTEPLLGFYSKDCYPYMMEHFNKKEYSLKNLLKDVNAKTIEPTSPQAIISIDTPEAFDEALFIISQRSQLNLN